MIATRNRYKSSEYGKPLKTPFGIPAFSLNTGTVDMQKELNTTTFCIGVPFELD